MGQRRITLLFFLLITAESCMLRQAGPKLSRKPSVFRQVGFQDLINRYMRKGENNSIEGVYSVSSTVIKKGKNLFGAPKEKTTDRNENYATVAILKEQGNGSDYIELSLNKKDLPSYSVNGEFNIAAGGNILVYKHFDKKGKDTSYTFTRDEKSEILEGVRVENDGGTQITYKLMYVKLTPKQ